LPMLRDITSIQGELPMGNKLSVKVTLNGDDPFDAEIIQALEKEKNRAGFFRKAVFCFIRGLGGSQPVISAAPTANREKDREINKKLSKLTDF
jgi:hypothetical protein